MNIFTIILFFVMTWGLGVLPTYFWKKGDIYESIIMRIGFGLGVFALLASLFSVIGIPLDWRIFLIIALIGPAYVFFKERQLPKFKMPSLQFIGAILVVGAMFYVYSSGAYSYPYLENDDPWAHAAGSKYIAETGTPFEPDPSKNLFFYLDARPPTYNALMGVLLQTTDRVSEVLKTFNITIICLSLLFFYFLVKDLLGRSNKAAFATFVLAMIPAYFTHFIWSHTLVIALFFPAIYAIRKIETTNMWMITAAISTAGILLTQETQSIKFLVLVAGYLGIRLILNRKNLIAQIGAVAIGGVLSLIWWVPAIMRYGGISNMLQWGIKGIPAGVIEGEKFIHPSITNVYFGTLGSATRQHGLYTFSDFFSAQNSMINVSVGIGLVAMILAIIGVFWIILKIQTKRKDTDYRIALWFILFFALFTFLGVHGGVRWWSPIALFPFRFWILFAVPIAILATEGVTMLQHYIKGKIPRLIIGIICALLIFTGSGQHKIDLNTSVWPPGGWLTSNEELQVFLSLTQLPPDTPVYSFYNYERVIGMDMYMCAWCEEELSYPSTGFDDSPEKFHSWLKAQGYQYWIVGSATYNNHGQEAVQAKITEAVESGRFGLAAQQGPFMLLAVS